jgi:hypothetical protein
MAVLGGTRPTRQLLARLPRPTRRTAAGACGLVGAVAAVFALGEIYLRVAPPSDLERYLIDGHRTGPFRDDPRYGVQYRSLDALAADNPVRFDGYRELLSNPTPPPTWAFFGSSFAQAPGMLADTARRFVPGRVVFNLGKNEPLPVRLAQAEFLLDHGLKAERIFLVVIPLDVYTFADSGLDQFRATPGGALAYAPRLPAVGGGVVRTSRLALKGWTRTTLHTNRPFFPPSALHDRVDPVVRGDVRTLFGRFADGAARHRVPVTVVLLPDYEQVCRSANRAVQDALADDARAVGFDVCDVSGPFRAWPDKPGLFIPDKHFSATGNRLLLAALLAHLKETDPRAAGLPDPADVRP